MVRETSIRLICNIMFIFFSAVFQPNSAQNKPVEGPPTLGKLYITRVTGNSANIEIAAYSNGAETVAWLEWGEVTPYSNIMTPEIFDWSLGYIIRKNIYNLNRDTDIHIRAVAQNQFGITYGSDTTFRTGALPLLSEPISLYADNITTTSAILHAKCSLHGAETWIQLNGGNKMSESLLRLGKVYIGSGNAEVETTFTVEGLIPNTVYNVRAEIYSNGLYLIGDNHTFSTLYDPAAKGIVIPIKVEDKLKRKNIRRFGVHTMATYCEDKKFDEYELPPPPPGSALESRFLVSCMGLGSYIDIRPFLDPSQIDTYRIKFQTDPIDGYPVKLSWPNLADLYAGKVVMRFPDDSVDMKDINSCQISDPEVNLLTIIAGMPIPVRASPIVISNEEALFGSDSGILRGEVNPNGVATHCWFEWGPDRQYGNLTRVVGVGNDAGPVAVSDFALGMRGGEKYHYRLVAKNGEGIMHGEDKIITTFASPVLDYRKDSPEGFSLEENFPNPLQRTTIINYRLPEESNVSLKVYDILGKLVSELINETESAGIRSVKWDGSNFANGLYYYKIIARSKSDPNKRFSMVRSMLLMK